MTFIFCRFVTVCVCVCVRACVRAHNGYNAAGSEDADEMPRLPSGCMVVVAYQTQRAKKSMQGGAFTYYQDWCPFVELPFCSHIYGDRRGAYKRGVLPAITKFKAERRKRGGELIT